MNQYKLGKSGHQPDARDLKLADYFKDSNLPEPPERFGHDKLIQHDAWGVLGNDEYGDCVWAGAAHETMLWNLYGNRSEQIAFTTQGVLSDYSAVTGFSPDIPDSDQGTYTRQALDYRRTTGIVDAQGKRHTIEAYVALEPGNTAQLFQALYIFGTVGIGIQFPDTAMMQFHLNERWHPEPLAQIKGGHYIPAVGRRNGIHIVTWGQDRIMSKSFYEEYCDEVYVALSTEMLDSLGRSNIGLDITQLRDDLGQVTA